MKRSACVALTLLLSIASIGFAQDLQPTNPSPPADEIANEPDTTRRPVQNYYYRSRMWDWWYRTLAPRRYYTIVNRPGYAPRSPRSESSFAHSRKRGGFGRSGSSPATT